MLIVEYQENWTNDFEQIKNLLIEHLAPLNVQVEHVGSTAVTGLSAKAIIDVDIVYFNSADFVKVKSKLEGVGYAHFGDQGIQGREVFKRNQNHIHPILDAIKHHMYVCHSKSEELERHLLFREHLRSNSEAREAYTKLKLEIAEEAQQDKKIYAALKENKAKAFINTCIEIQKTNGK